MRPIRTLSRGLVGAVLAAEGIAVLRRPSTHADSAAAILDPIERATGTEIDATLAVRASGAALTGLAGAVGLGFAPRAAAAASAAILAPATALGYQFWRAHGEEREAKAAGFFQHLALFAAALAIAAGPRTPRSERLRLKAKRAKRSERGAKVRHGLHRAGDAVHQVRDTFGDL
ncbi:MAG: hypothetical protein LBM66_02755 [Bifidobacteriaceae bacterium]|jgi:uncharacterized membrane protein YphA (DoxX/SURF4 family)|nr:hypothetical protein [Bifidobacteriaceae bacterium]